MADESDLAAEKTCTVYFDTSFFVDLARAPGNVAERVTTFLRSRNVRYVECSIVWQELTSYMDKNYQRGFGRRAKYPRAPGEAAAQVGRRGCIENGVVWVRWGKHTEMLDVFGARIASQSEV